MDNSQTGSENTLEYLADKNIVLLTQRGFQSGESVSQYQTRVDELTSKLHTEGKKVLILVDMVGVTGYDAEARKQGEERIKGNYDAMAVFGTDATMRIIVNFMITVRGLGSRAKFFGSRDEATEWLLKQT